MFVFASVALSASSYPDAVGDANTPPDITSVGVLDRQDGTVEVTVSVANFATLPANSSFTVWFDVDGNPETGNADGREAYVRYLAAGGIELQLWSGTRLVDRPATGITGRFEGGVLSLSVPKATLGLASAFGILAVSARGQRAGAGEILAQDIAPEGGTFRYAGTDRASFPDRVNDHESAPDLTSVQMSDSADGWISFSVTIGNRAALPRDPVVGISIDADDELRTGDGGADVALSALGGDVAVDRWSPSARQWTPDVDDPRVRVESAGDVITVSALRADLDAGKQIAFAVLAAGITAARMFTGIDVAPDGARFYRYELTHADAARLTTGKPRTSPARPSRGSRVTVTTAVSRSDTSRTLASGAVSCKIAVDGRRVRAAGRFTPGRASCAFTIPKTGRRVAGTMTVRALGISVVVPVSFAVR